MARTACKAIPVNNLYTRLTITIGLHTFDSPTLAIYMAPSPRIRNTIGANTGGGNNRRAQANRKVTMGSSDSCAGRNFWRENSMCLVVILLQYKRSLQLVETVDKAVPDFRNTLKPFDSKFNGSFLEAFGYHACQCRHPVLDQNRRAVNGVNTV